MPALFKQLIATGFVGTEAYILHRSVVELYVFMSMRFHSHITFIYTGLLVQYRVRITQAHQPTNDRNFSQSHSSIM